MSFQFPSLGRGACAAFGAVLLSAASLSAAILPALAPLAGQPAF